MDQNGGVSQCAFFSFIGCECHGIGIGVDGNNRICSVIFQKILYGDLSIELIHDSIFCNEKTDDSVGFCFCDNGGQVPVFIRIPP